MKAQTYPPIKEEDLVQFIVKVNKGHDTIDGPAGFTFQSTPGHGYLKTAKHLTAKIPAYMRSTNFSRAGRYEEDCDWCIPVVIHRHLFSEKIQTIALKCFYNWHWEEFTKLFKRTPIDSAKYKDFLKEKSIKKLDQNSYRVISRFGSWHQHVPKGSTGVIASRLSDGKEISVLVPKEYREEILPPDHTYPHFNTDRN